MPCPQDSDRKHSSSSRPSHSSRSKSTRDHRDDRDRDGERDRERERDRHIDRESDKDRDRDRHQRHRDHFPDPDPPSCLQGETSRPNPLYHKAFLDKDNNRLVLSHVQYLYEPSKYPDLIRYDSSRPLSNLLLRLWGTPFLVLADLLQYPPPSSSTICPRSDWLRAQAWFLDDDRNPRKHPVFKYQFLTMESLSTLHEDFMVMFSRDIPPWIMRKMDNWRPYCELGGHNQLNHYLLGWCWFWLQMEVSQRVDRVRAFLLEEDYDRLRAKDGRDRERERVRREMEEEEDDENPFKRFGVKKEEAVREARDFVERMSGIGALWFPDSEKKGKFEKYFGDAIPSKRKLSGEGNTREYCVACNLSVVAGSGEEVLAALLANMIARAPCKNDKDVAEEDGGLPRLYPLVDTWIENLGEERAKVVKEKAKKLALTLFTIRKYLRWKKTPQGRDKWLYTDLGTDPYHPYDMNLTPSPSIRMMKAERAVKREWECFCKGEDPLDEEKDTLPVKEETGRSRYLEPVPEERNSSTSPSRHLPPSSSSRHPPSSSSSSSHRSSSSLHPPQLSSPSPSSRRPPTSSSPYSSRNRDRESYSSKHTVPLSFYNLSNSQVSPAPAPSRVSRTYGTYGSPRYEITAVPVPVQGTVTVPGTGTALVRTRDYPSEEWDNSDSDSESFDGEFDDDATTLTCNSFTTVTGTGSDRRVTNLSNENDQDNEIEIMSVATWSHLSAVPEALNLRGLGGGGGKSKREEAEAQTQRERERYRKERERYRHEGEESLVSSTSHGSSHPSSQQQQHSRSSSTDTRDWAKNGGDRDRDRDHRDRERYRHEGGDRHGDNHHRHGTSSSSSSSSSSSRRHRRADDDAELTRTALKLLSIKDHLHLARKRH